MSDNIPFEILESDKFFYDSPDCGHPACLCSRCGQRIPENQIAIRAWPTVPGDFGYDPNAAGGTEFRYHPSCLGIITVDPFELDDEDWERDDDDPNDSRNL